MFPVWYKAWTPWPTMSRHWDRCATGIGDLPPWLREGSDSPAPNSTDATPAMSSIWRWLWSLSIAIFLPSPLRVLHYEPSCRHGFFFLLLLFYCTYSCPPSFPEGNGLFPASQVSVLHHSAPVEHVNHMAAQPQYMRPVHHPLMIHSLNSHMPGKPHQ